MRQLNTLRKVYEYGEVLTSDGLNQIISYINDLISVTNELVANSEDSSHYEIRYKNSVVQPNPPAEESDGLSDGWSTTMSSPNYSNNESTWRTQCLKMNNGEYGIWSTPIKLVGERGKFKSRVFARTNSDISNNAPQGGTYDSPYPNPITQNGVTWYDGIPSGNKKLWSSVCTFNGDGSSSGWSNPSSETDTTVLDIEFSPQQSQPNPPQGNTPFTNHESEEWYDPNSDNFSTAGNMIWRAERKISNGVYDGDWTITRIYGETGQSGESAQFIYKHFETEQDWENNSSQDNPANWSALQDEDNSDTYNRYLGPTGHQWSDVPQGIGGVFKYEYISIRKKQGDTWSIYSTPKLYAYKGAEGISPTVYALKVDISDVHYSIDYAGNIIWNPSSINISIKTVYEETYDTLQSLPQNWSISRQTFREGTILSSGNILQPGSINISSIAINNNFVGDTIIISLLNSSNEVVDSVTIKIIKDVHQMLISSGNYVSRTYSKTDYIVPLVFSVDRNKYYYLVADTNYINGQNIAPDDTAGNPWAAATEYQVILTKALFAHFANLGSFVIWEDYFFSQYGYKIDSNGNALYTTSASDYQYFDGTDPMASNNPNSGEYKFRPMKCINAKTGEEWSAGGNVHMSSSGDVTVEGDIIAKTLIAGDLNGLNITTTSNTISFNFGNDSRAYFINDSNGMQLMIKDSNGDWQKIDWTNWIPVTSQNATSTMELYKLQNSLNGRVESETKTIYYNSSNPNVYYSTPEGVTLANTTGNYYKKQQILTVIKDGTKYRIFNAYLYSPAQITNGNLQISSSDRCIVKEGMYLKNTLTVHHGSTISVNTNNIYLYESNDPNDIISNAYSNTPSTVDLSPLDTQTTNISTVECYSTIEFENNQMVVSNFPPQSPTID